MYGKKPSRKSNVVTCARSHPWRKRFALSRASSARAPVALKTTQWISTSGCAARSVSTVPPAPISISSECAPRHSTCLSPSIRSARISAPCRRPPYRPWRLAAAPHPIEDELVLERVHRPPEAPVLGGAKPPLRDQTLERLCHELLPLVQVVEYCRGKHHVGAVEPVVAVGNAAQPQHDAVVGDPSDVV